MLFLSNTGAQPAVQDVLANLSCPKCTNVPPSVQHLLDMRDICDTGTGHKALPLTMRVPAAQLTMDCSLLQADCDCSGWSACGACRGA